MPLVIQIIPDGPIILSGDDRVHYSTSAITRLLSTRAYAGSYKSYC